MSHPRFTLRWLMVAVAIIAIAIAAVRWMRAMDARSADYSQRALSHHARIAADYGLLLRRPADPRAGELLERRKAYRRAMAEKWNRAALYPWLAVAPDPPEPE